MGISASAEKVGEALSTDIAAFIDNSPIVSFNFNDFTYVSAEDLRNYGFTVSWDNDLQGLNITRPERNFTPYIDEFVNAKKSNSLYTPSYDVYSADVSVYTDGSPVQAYSIDGKTVIKISDLQCFGILIYKQRRCELDILSRELENCENIGGEVGFYENGELVYGRKMQRLATEHIIEYGNFRDGKIITFENVGYGDIYSYVTPQSVVYTKLDNCYIFGQLLTCIQSADGVTKRYLSNSGELYSIERDDIIGLYDGGELIYCGGYEMETLPIKLLGHYPEHEYNVYYLPDYSSEKGVIYYCPEALTEGGYIFYRGRVENGKATGEGILYNTYDTYFELMGTAKVKTRKNGIIEEHEPVPWDILYIGEFVNGMPDGYGAVYDCGIPEYEGEVKNGLRHGEGIDYIIPEYTDVFEGVKIRYENGVDIW